MKHRIYIQDCSQSAVQWPKVTGQRQENNLERSRSLFFAAVFVKNLFCCWIHSILWRKQNLVNVVNLFVINHSFLRLLLSWFLIQRFQKAKFLDYRENTQSFWSNDTAGYQMTNNCVKKTLWNFEKSAIDFLIPYLNVKMVQSLAKSYDWMRNLLNWPIIWVSWLPTVADFWSFGRIVIGGDLLLRKREREEELMKERHVFD